MNIIDQWYLVWILMSLITSLVFSTQSAVEGEGIESWGSGEWIIWLLLSMLWPLGLFLIAVYLLYKTKTMKAIGRFLTKDLFGKKA